MPVRVLQPLSVQSKTTKTPIMKDIPASKVKSKEAHQEQNCVDKRVFVLWKGCEEIRLQHGLSSGF
ncbi:unnamed protein product [Meloidogyne enterolobii]|uniref:Uncharacterized protein n=1 Tax=Meloidogyne enterolobii TaxID=390850 RepID=A0ACB0YGQ7_MELEN